MQRIQNRAARIVCGVSRLQQNAWQLCYNLHWLPVYSRADFKLATLCFKSHVTRQLDYLAVTLDRSPIMNLAIIDTTFSFCTIL